MSTLCSGYVRAILLCYIIHRTISLTTGGKCDSISLGKEQTLTIDGPVELYVTGDISMGQLAAIQIIPTFRFLT